MTQKPRAYIFVGGGTGGHLYPALAIREHIMQINPDAITRFVCSDREIDSQILSDADVEFISVSAKPISKSAAGLRAFASGWRSSSSQMRALMIELLPTRDVVVVAMGGFVAPPCAWAARRLRVPVVLVNLDAVPGKANLLVAKFADKVCTALPAANKPWTVLGPMVRANANSQNEQTDAAYRVFDLDPDKRTLLVTGGSQGAKSINDFLRAMLGNFPDAFEGWQIIHQTGGDGDPSLAEIYRHAKINAWVGAYIDRMDAALACADLTLARCGAGTVGEVWAASVPALFMPYPFHKDQHQKHNARVLVEEGCAIVLDDHVEGAANIESHGTVVAAILQDEAGLERMKQGFDAMGSAGGAAAAAAMLVGFRL